MPLSFPSNPTVSQQATVNNRTYSWSGYAWELVAASGSGSLSATVTIPGLGDPYWSNTSLLLNMNGANNSTSFNDSSNSGVTVTAYGDAKISTAQSKFGGSSAAFDGAGDYLSVPTGGHINFGSGDYCVECWFRMPTTTGALQGLFGYQDQGGDYAPILRAYVTSSGVLQFTFRGTGTGATDLAAQSALSANTWHYLAIAKTSGTTRLYLNGVLQSSTAANASINATFPVFIGGVCFDSSGFVWPLTGWINDFRITVGTGRGYTGSTISVPTAAFSKDLVVPVVGTGSVGSGLSWSNVPASATASGTAGQIAYDGEYLYVASATNTWVRAALSTWVPPTITISGQPSNQTASAGSATFSVTASVTQSATLAYQWQQSTDSGTTWANISGAAGSSLALTGLTTGSNGYQYRVVVSATGGAASVTSNAATLTVASSRVFSSVSNTALSSVTGSGTSTLSATKDSSSGSGSFTLTFTAPAATLTVTRSATFSLVLSATFAFTGATLQKNGRYEKALGSTGSSTSTLNVAGTYQLASGSCPSGSTMTLALS